MAKTSIYKLALSLLICLSILSSCEETEDAKDYDWHVDKEFVVPKDWHRQDIKDAFTVSMPKYVHASKTPRDTICNAHNDLMYLIHASDMDENPVRNIYSQDFEVRDKDSKIAATVAISYIRREYDYCWRYCDPLDMDGEKSSASLFKMVRNQIIPGEFIRYAFKSCYMNMHNTYVMDVCYNRHERVKGDGMETVHIFLMQNSDEAAMITVSCHHKDITQYREMFNMIHSFEWKNEKLFDYE